MKVCFKEGRFLKRYTWRLLWDAIMAMIPANVHSVPRSSKRGQVFVNTAKAMSK